MKVNSFERERGKNVTQLVGFFKACFKLYLEMQFSKKILSLKIFFL